MAERKTTIIRVPLELKKELEAIAKAEERDQIVVLNRIWRKGLALEKANA